MVLNFFIPHHINSKYENKRGRNISRKIMTQEKTKTEIFIEKARKIHGDKYDYSKAEYINAKTKICIICPKHGEFWQTPDSHMNQRRGCPKCGVERCNKGRKKWTEETLKEIVAKYPTQTELQKHEGGAYNALRRMNLLYKYYPRQNDKPWGYWNVFENVQKEAQKYTSRWDFGKDNGSAYDEARRNKWMDKHFS